MNNSIGPKIKKIREEKHLTQEQLADILGYSHKSVITHIEKGDADMTYEKIQLLLRELALDANDLFTVERIDKNIEEYKSSQKKNRTVIVYIHGQHGSYKEVDNYKYLENKYDLVGLNYQDGNPWEVKDTIRDEFKKITKGYKDIIVISYSIGAFYTYEYLSNFNIKQAFFISPVADMYEIGLSFMKQYGITEEQLKKEKYIELPNKQALFYEFQNHIKEHKENWTVPTNILYGTKDKLITPTAIISFMGRHPNTSLTVKEGAEHYLHTPEEKEFIKNWILKNLNK